MDHKAYDTKLHKTIDVSLDEKDSDFQKRNKY